MSDLLARTFKEEFKEFDSKLSDRQEYYLTEERVNKWKRVLKKWRNLK